MRFEQVREGRIFIIRLEDGDEVQKSIELFAKSKNIDRAKVQLLGGVDKGSVLIVGPKSGRAKPIEPMMFTLNEMHEAVGNGTIFPDENGNPKLHCHLVCGRGDQSLCGEIKMGVRVWHVMELVITELVDSSSIRKLDPETGFELLYPPDKFEE